LLDHIFITSQIILALKDLVSNQNIYYSTPAGLIDFSWFMVPRALPWADLLFPFGELFKKKEQR